MSLNVSRAVAITLFWFVATSAISSQQQTAQSSKTQEQDAGQHSPAPSAESIFRIDVRRVAVDVQVVDKKSLRPIQGLTPADFIVGEDGTVQQLMKSGIEEELPLSVVLLFDLTDSVRPVLESLAGGAREALNHLKTDDEVAVMTYSASAQLIQDFTRDRDLTVAAIAKASHMQSDEAAFFNEGIYQAAAKLGRADPARRRVIIWFTDDIPNYPTDEVRAHYARSLGKHPPHTENEALTELLRTGTAVSTLLQHSQVSDTEFSLRLSKASETMMNNMRYPPGEVHKYAQASGGNVVESSGRRAREQLSALIDNLRMRYTLIYKPQTEEPKGKFCRLTVRLTPEAAKAHPHVFVLSRQGYYR